MKKENMCFISTMFLKKFYYINSLTKKKTKKQEKQKKNIIK